MSVNFKKLKSQIHKFSEGGKVGYEFQPTPEQFDKDIFGIRQIASKRIFMYNMSLFVNDIDEYRDEFSL